MENVRYGKYWHGKCLVRKMSSTGNGVWETTVWEMSDPQKAVPCVNILAFLILKMILNTMLSNSITFTVLSQLLYGCWNCLKINLWANVVEVGPVTPILETYFNIGLVTLHVGSHYVKRQISSSSFSFYHQICCRTQIMSTCSTCPWLMKPENCHL